MRKKSYEGVRERQRTLLGAYVFAEQSVKESATSNSNGESHAAVLTAWSVVYLECHRNGLRPRADTRPYPKLENAHV